MSIHMSVAHRRSSRPQSSRHWEQSSYSPDRDWSTKDHGEAEGKSCLIPTTLVGVTLVVIGILNMQAAKTSGSDARRAVNVDSFNKVVDEWQDPNLKQFMGISFQVQALGDRLPNATATGALHNFTMDSDPDPINDIQPDLHPYTSLKYVTEEPILDSLPKWEYPYMPRLHFTASVAPTYPAASGAGATGGRAVVSEFTLPAFNLTTQEKHRSGNWKDCVHSRHGSWRPKNHSCIIYKVLKSLCFTVDVKPDGQVQLPANAQGPQSPHFGCKQTVGLEKDRAWTGLKYKTATVAGARSAGMPLSTQLGDLRITIRSSADPHLVAQVLTEGRLHFGTTQKEERWHGMAMVVIGALMCLPALMLGCIALCNALHRWRTRHKYSTVAEVVPVDVQGDDIHDIEEESPDIPAYRL